MYVSDSCLRVSLCSVVYACLSPISSLCFCVHFYYSLVNRSPAVCSCFAIACPSLRLSVSRICVIILCLPSSFSVLDPDSFGVDPSFLERMMWALLLARGVLMIMRFFWPIWTRVICANPSCKPLIEGFVPNLLDFVYWSSLGRPVFVSLPWQVWGIHVRKWRLTVETARQGKPNMSFPLFPDSHGFREVLILSSSQFVEG